METVSEQSVNHDERRQAAKKARDFAQSDKIRAELLAAGIILEDKPDGSTNWRRA